MESAAVAKRDFLLRMLSAVTMEVLEDAITELTRDRLLDPCPPLGVELPEVPLHVR